MIPEPLTTNSSIKKYLLPLIYFIAIISITVSCTSTSKLYLKNRNQKGKLTDSVFTAVQHFLSNYKNIGVTDTLLIKYDYNNETCWNILDQNDDQKILQFIAADNQKLQKTASKRQNVSVFRFREPGDNLNKLIKWNNSIIIDSSKQLLNLLFKNRCTCGASIMIMPDKLFIVIRSDSHSDVFELKRDKIDAILGK